MSACDLDLNGKSMFPALFKDYISDSLLYSFQKPLISCFSLLSLRRGCTASRSGWCYVVPGWSDSAGVGVLLCV